MNKCMFVTLILFLLLLGCQETQSTERQLESSDPSMSKHKNVEKKEDFIVTIEGTKQVYSKDEEINIYATLTYKGNGEDILINHASSIFYYKIHQKDGDFELESIIDLVRKSTNLRKNKPHISDLDNIGMPVHNVFRNGKLYLPTGQYLITAIADFNLENNEEFNIPVSLTIEVKE